MNIALVIPCYRVRESIKPLLEKIGKDITHIFCVDDACPEKTGDFIEEKIHDPRVRVLRHKKNRGVGGAVITGYQMALAENCDIIVKLDGDGQMDPTLLPFFVEPIRKGEADYTKGNRFYNLHDIRKMPTIRIFGNAVLSFMTKFSSGYWHIFDPTNGYTAIHRHVLALLPLEKIDSRFFFESDMLHYLYGIRAKVVDVPMQARYDDEESNLCVGRVLIPFLFKNFRNYLRRIFYAYFIRDFSVATVELVLGVASILFGTLFGIMSWADYVSRSVPAPAGTVMLAALPVLIGVNMLLSFLNYDISSTPQMPLHSRMAPAEQARERP